MIGQARRKIHDPMLINGAAGETPLTKLADTKIHSPKRNISNIECHLHTSTAVRCSVGVTEGFEVKVGLH